MADDVGIKIRVGITDKEATDWSGTVTVAPGSVSLIGGWRFAQGLEFADDTRQNYIG